MIHAIRCLSIRLVLILIAWVGTFSVAFAAETDRVLVVRNGNSAISRAVADDYAQRRGIRNVITLTCPDAAVDPLAEAIDFASYQTKIETPLLAFLAAHPGIDFIVLTKGLPRVEIGSFSIQFANCFWKRRGGFSHQEIESLYSK